MVRLLRRAGVDRLALVVATHPSRDHHGGLAAVLRRFPVDTLLDGGDGTRDPSFHALERLADERGVKRIAGVAPLALTLAGGGLRIRVLSPPPRPPGPPPDDPNPRAVVAIVSSGGFDMMLSADAESEAPRSRSTCPTWTPSRCPITAAPTPGCPRCCGACDPRWPGSRWASTTRTATRRPPRWRRSGKRTSPPTAPTATARSRLRPSTAICAWRPRGDHLRRRA